MGVKRQVLGEAPARHDLEDLVGEARRRGMTEEDFAEQRVSFAYGNAPANSRITKESVREATRTYRLDVA
jgi:hypothetical protein